VKPVPNVVNWLAALITILSVPVSALLEVPPMLFAAICIIAALVLVVLLIWAFLSRSDVRLSINYPPDKGA
jgi:hypothetical protein